MEAPKVFNTEFYILEFGKRRNDGSIFTKENINEIENELKALINQEGSVKSYLIDEVGVLIKCKIEVEYIYPSTKN